MRARVYVYKAFDKWAKHEKVSDEDLLDAANEIEDGLIDANLGGGVVKKRLARRGGGKSGGYRTIVFFYEKLGDRLVFSAAFPKNAQSNIGDKALEVFKKLAKVVLAANDQQTQQLVDDGTLREISRISPGKSPLEKPKEEGEEKL